jgi:putative membrane protein
MKKEVVEVILFNHGGRFGPPDRGFVVHHGWWWGFWAHFIPFLFFVALIGLVVWAVLRLSGRTYAPAMAAAPAGFVPAPRMDPALEEVRLRYARGEMSREEFVQRSQDLGGGPHTGGAAGLAMREPGEPEAEGGEPTQPEGGEPSAPQAE